MRTAFDRRVPTAYAEARREAAASYSSDAFEAGPLSTFIRLERENWKQHNVELLFEFAWIRSGANRNQWNDIVYNGVYFFLFEHFQQQFGTGIAGARAPLRAGSAMAARLFAGDQVINLNYDIALDLAMQQRGKFFSYSPNPQPHSIVMYKPHGSLNLYACDGLKRWGFSNPSFLLGSVSVRFDGGVWSPSSAIVPPRLNKAYAQHPIAEHILYGLDSVAPEVVTFWGVGLTVSDADLLATYRRACTHARQVEFINPDESILDVAREMLGIDAVRYWPLAQWEGANPIPE